MKMTTGTKPPPWFWAVVIAAIIWNLLGVGAYLADVTRSDDALATLPEAQRALFESVPLWATSAYAIAVFAGLGGSALLAFRRRYATATLGLSLAAIVIQMFHAFVLSDTLAVMGPMSAVMPAIVAVVAAALVSFALYARGQGWLA